MAAKELFNQPLTATPGEDDRASVAATGETGARNIKYKHLRRESRNAGDVDTDTLIPLPTGRGFRYVATQPLALIATQVQWENPDTGETENETLQDGETLEVAFDGAGKTISHNRPAAGTDLPIWLIAEADYTTSKEIELFTFRLFTLSIGRVWVEVSNSSVAGSVSPDFYIGAPSQQQGYEVQESATVTGFETGRLTSFTVYGEGQGTWTSNAAGDSLVYNGIGADRFTITQVIDAIGRVYSFSVNQSKNGIYVGLSDDGKQCFVSSVTNSVAKADDAIFSELKNGNVEIANDSFILNSTSKEAQILV